MLSNKIGLLLLVVFLALTVDGFARAAGLPQAAKSQGKAEGKPAVAVTVAESSSRSASGSGRDKDKGTPSPKSGVLAPADLDLDAYRIGVEDELQVSVWREPELSIQVVVRPDGMVSMPLLNDVYVVGLKPVELQAILTEKLKSFVNEPQVTVIVRGIRSRRVHLVGEVGKQGSYPLNGRKTVLELIVEAGGLGPFAKADSIYILRKVGNRQVRIPFRYKKAIAGAGQADNVVLMPGDIIVVP